ncbi:MAG TPA: hypothetical protein VIF15_12985 [Polyangiaceae bacterium]|jgi:hypothetical protein
MTRRRLLVLSACAACAARLLWPGAALASPLIETAGAIGGNAGEQGVVAGPGAASTYFNPALLTDADEELLLGFSLLSEQMGVTLDGRNGGDVPLIVSGRDVVTPGGQPLGNSVVPTQWLQQGCPGGSGQGECPPPGYLARPRQSQGTSGKTRTYLTLGLVKHLVKDRFTLGLYTMLPLSSFTTAQAFYPDEREALFTNSLHPELYGDRLTAVSLVLGAGFKLLPGLSIGAGLSIGLANAATSADYVNDATNYSTLLLNNGVTTQINVAPTAGVAWRPIDALRIGGAVHSPESFAIDTTIDASLPSGTESGATLREVFDWMPWSVAVGAEGEVVHRGRYRMTVVGSIDYAFWSSYRDRQGNSPSMYGSDLAWRDTMSLAVGTRQSFGSWRAFVDLKYVPSPVPEQVGRSNYVDNDRVGISAGGDVALKLGPARLRPGIQMFASRLVPRQNTKDGSRIVDELPDGSVFGSTHDPVPGAQGLQTNNPGWPGFASGGWLWGGTITVSVPL